MSKPPLPSGTVTFLFTDIEGSTRLLQQLGSECYAQVLGHHHAIQRAAFEKFNGSEIDTQGDAFFVSFPRATEAVAATAEIQRLLNAHEWPEGVQVRVRMGLHTGEPLSGDAGYVGLDVHRAARIAHVGHGGQVLLSEATAMLTRGNLPAGVQLVDLGLHQLKDMPFPEHIRQLSIDGLSSVFPPLNTLPVIDPDERLDLEPPPLPAYLEKEAGDLSAPLFVAREREMEWLTQRLGRVLQKKGEIVFVTGEAGIGKSALLQHLARMATEDVPNLLVTWGAGNALIGSGDAYLPFRQALSLLSGDVQQPWQSKTIGTEQARRLWQAMPQMVQVISEKGQALAGSLVDGRALLGRAEGDSIAGDSYFYQLDRLVRRIESSKINFSQDQLFQQCVTVLQTLSEKYPLLMLFDDLQWADNASMNLLFHLGRDLNDSQIMIIGAFRPDEVALGLEGARHPLEKVVTELRRLRGDIILDLEISTDVEKRNFLDALLDKEPNSLGRSFRQALLAHTGGQPLFTVEMLRNLQERGDLVKNVDGLWTVTPDIGWDDLPHRVEGVIEERINRLEPELQDILTVASVEGEVFTTQVVADVQNLSERDLLHHLSRNLERRHRLVQEHEEIDTGRKTLSRYRFSHVLFQDYLYKRLSQGEQRLLHQEIAMALQKHYCESLEEMAVQLAYHFHQAGDYDSAFQYSSKAATRAASIYASGEAISHYTTAIQLADKASAETDQLANLHHGRGLAYCMVGEFEPAQADFVLALQIARSVGKSQLEWQVLIDQGRSWASRDYIRAHDCFQEALTLASQIDQPKFIAESLNWIGNWYINQEKPLAARTHHQKALEKFELAGNKRGLAVTFDLLGISSVLSDDLVASVGYYDQAIALLRELDDRPHLCSSLIGRGHASGETFTSRTAISPHTPRSPEQDFEEANRIAGEIGSLADEAWHAWSLGRMYTVHGHFGQALDVIQYGLHLASQIGHREWIVGNRHALGTLHLALLAPGEALKELELALPLAEELQSKVWIHVIIGGMAEAYCQTNDGAQARILLDSVLSIGTSMDTEANRFCWAKRAELALLQDEPNLALDIVERLITSAPGMSPECVISFLWKLKGEALAANGDTETAIRLIGEALEDAQLSGERYLLWRLHAGLGQLYHLIGRPSEAAEELIFARDIIKELTGTLPESELRNKFLQRAQKHLKIPQ